MQKVCKLRNHVATFESAAAWGICAAMVCKWLRKVQNNEAVNHQNDIDQLGAIILEQGRSLRAGQDADDQQRFLFHKHGFQNLGKVGFAEGVFSERLVANWVATPGNRYVSIQYAGGGHAIGTAATVTSWMFCDPELGYLENRRQGGLHRYVSSTFRRL